MTDRRFSGEVAGWTYCYTQDINGKHHIADRRGRAYMCPCGRQWALQARLGILPRWGAAVAPFPRFNRYGFARVRR